MLKTYISKPREIQAIQYTGDNFDEIKKFVGVICDLHTRSKDPWIPPDIYMDFGGYYIVASYGDYVFKNMFGKVCTASKCDFESCYRVKE